MFDLLFEGLSEVLSEGLFEGENSRDWEVVNPSCGNLPQ